MISDHICYIYERLGGIEAKTTPQKQWDMTAPELYGYTEDVAVTTDRQIMAR
ncbi:hypothetical protein ACIQ6U_02515 [Lysinibacillus fusiformis]|uniref:hypothetical protein n=1 Tax=Lysinibacillus fusiformis TaxID=28031 RepID=UPI0037F3EC2F